MPSPTTTELPHPSDLPSTAKGGAWSHEHSEKTYRTQRWGQGYFRINEDGNLHTNPLGPDGPSIDLHEIVEGLSERGIDSPISSITVSARYAMRFKSRSRRTTTKATISRPTPSRSINSTMLLKKSRDMGTSLGMGSKSVQNQSCWPSWQ